MILKCERMVGVGSNAGCRFDSSRRERAQIHVLKPIRADVLRQHGRADVDDALLDEQELEVGRDGGGDEGAAGVRCVPTCVCARGALA